MENIKILGKAFALFITIISIITFIIGMGFCLYLLLGEWMIAVVLLTTLFLGCLFYAYSIHNS